MSLPCYDRRLKNDVKKYHAAWLTQVYRWLFLIAAMSLKIFADELESRNALFVNFHRKYNVSKVILRNDGYLPPVIMPDFSPSEVIDNRARNMATVMNETRNYPNALYLPERDSLRILVRKGLQDARYLGSRLQTSQYHHHRPILSQDKHFRQTTTQLSSPPSPPLAETPASSENRISIEEMSCQNAGDELFFRASIKAPKNSASPVIENVGEACRAIAIRNTYRINFEKDQFWDCGVVDCSTDDNQLYCLNLRFPVISGLRLKDDYRVMLQCKTQNRIAYHTRQINVKTLGTKARNIPRVLTGGFSNALDVDVGLFRKTYGSENIFDTRIHKGGTVVLGEEILLRVLVNGGDGWRYLKIGQVTMHYTEMRQQQNIVNSLWILDKNGCLNTDVREICSREQYMASSLESYLIFQAFMFEGMKESEEIFLTVKAIACLDAIDCILDCPAGHLRRVRRNAADQNNMIEWQDDIALRIVLPKYELRASQNYYLTILLSAIVILALMLLWFIKISFNRRTARF